MSKWQQVKLGDYCEITSSKRIFYSDYVADGVPFFRSKEIIERQNGSDISEPLFISTEKYESIKSQFGIPLVGDMLLTSVGTIGIAYIVKPDDYFYFKDGNLTWFRNFSPLLSSKYLYYWITSQKGKGILYNSTIGSSQKALTISALKKLIIPLPPIEVQRKIADVLSAYDDLIENNRKQIKLLEEAAQRLYKEWFIDLRFPGHETTKIINGIPDGWVLKNFSDVFTYERGKSYSSSEIDNYAEVLLVNLKNIKAWGGYNRNAEKYFSGIFKPEQLLHRNDIVMAVTDMTQERRLVGHVALIPQLDMPAIFSMDLIRIIPKSLSVLFLYSVLAFGEYGTKISLLANGTNVLHLKPDAMMSQKILIPPSNIVEEYEKLFSAIRDKIEYLEMQNSKSTEARDRLLPKLMNGELEVK